MKHIFSSRVRIVLVVAIALAVILAAISGLTGMSLPDMLVKGVLTPVRAAFDQQGASQLQGHRQHSGQGVVIDIGLLIHFLFQCQKIHNLHLLFFIPGSGIPPPPGPQLRRRQWL